MRREFVPLARNVSYPIPLPFFVYCDFLYYQQVTQSQLFTRRVWYKGFSFLAFCLSCYELARDRPSEHRITSLASIVEFPLLLEDGRQVGRHRNIGW